MIKLLFIFCEKFCLIFYSIFFTYIQKLRNVENAYALFFHIEDL